MKCELDYCIYNRKLECVSGDIHINSLGMCEDCQIVTISERILEKYKEKQLEKIEKFGEYYEE